MFIVRRFAIAFILVSLRNINIWVRCVSFSVVQVIYLILLIASLPFKEAKHNIIEIINELVFLYLSIFATICIKDSNKFYDVSHTLVYTFVVNLSIISGILIFDIVVKLIKHCKNSTKQKKQAQKLEGPLPTQNRIMRTRNNSISTKDIKITKFKKSDENIHNFDNSKAVAEEEKNDKSLSRDIMMDSSQIFYDDSLRNTMKKTNQQPEATFDML